MISQHLEEQASLYALGTLPDAERAAFETALRANVELQRLVQQLQRTTDLLALNSPLEPLPASLRNKVLNRVASLAETDKTKTATTPPKPSLPPLLGLSFLDAPAEAGWKPLPVPGTYIKLLSLEKERGYAVLMGKLDPGARYPAHTNAGPEDFYILTGDLHIGNRRLGAGDFHHADKGSQHEENYSVEGCTLLAVLTTDDPLVAFAMA